MSLRAELRRIASEHPETRKHLLPLLKMASHDMNPKKFADMRAAHLNELRRIAGYGDLPRPRKMPASKGFKDKVQTHVYMSLRALKDDVPEKSLNQLKQILELTVENFEGSQVDLVGWATGSKRIPNRYIKEQTLPDAISAWRDKFSDVGEIAQAQSMASSLNAVQATVALALFNPKSGSPRILKETVNDSSGEYLKDLIRAMGIAKKIKF